MGIALSGSRFQQLSAMRRVVARRAYPDPMI
jgi:hypothetical protein